MGGAVSSGESNDELIDNLKESDYIKSPTVEKVFRAVDRGFYYTKSHPQNPYQDTAWKYGNLHISAPCIYSEVLENLDLEPGLSFLNIGSGTGYLSTLAGLMLGRSGTNHGIELHEDAVEYARFKLDRFKKCCPGVDIFELCEPEFVVGNCIDALPVKERYDRIYCGAACPPEILTAVIESLKIGGIAIVPVNDALVKITRTSGPRIERKHLMSVSFASLITKDIANSPQIDLPHSSPLKLKDICRAIIREAIRKTCDVTVNDEKAKVKKPVKKRGMCRGSVGIAVARPARPARPGGDREFDLEDFRILAPITMSFPRHRRASHSSSDSGHSEEANESPPVASQDSDNEEVKEATAEAATAAPVMKKNDHEANVATHVSSSEGSSSTKIPAPATPKSPSEDSAAEESAAFSSTEEIGDSTSQSSSSKPRTSSQKRTISNSGEATENEKGEADDAGSDTEDDEEANPKTTNVKRVRRYSSSDVAAVLEYQRIPPELDSESSLDSSDDDDGEMGGHVHIVTLASRSPTGETVRDLSSEYVDEPLPDVTHPLTVEMRSKIQLLPLPIAMKTYLNYNRKLY